MRSHKTNYRLLYTVIFFGLTIPGITQQSPYVYNYESKESSILKTLIFYTGVQMHNLSIERGVIEHIRRVDPYKLWKIDRPAISLFSKSSDRWSDVTMYGSIALPLIFNISSSIEKHDKWNIALMGLQGFAIENGINVLVKNLAQRPRPFLYNNEWIINNRSINKNSSRSFYSGHTSTSAYMCFFGAKVFADLHPDSKWKPIIWSLAITLPALTGYLRYDAGQHFATDIIAGYFIGASIGFLVPAFNKNNKANLTFGMAGLQISLNL